MAGAAATAAVARKKRRDALEYVAWTLHDGFPTLKEALLTVPPGVGFVVEVRTRVPAAAVTSPLRDAR